MLPRFELAAARRPVDLVRPGSTLEDAAAPYLAVVAEAVGAGPVTLGLVGDWLEVRTHCGAAVSLEVTAGGETTTHRSLRHGRPDAPVEALAVTLTGTQVTALTREDGRWQARARYDVRDRVDVHGLWGERIVRRDGTSAEPSGMRAESAGPVADVRAGAFGQVGLRDLRAVTHADGTPYRDDGDFLLTATSAGPGGFGCGHASVWALDPARLDLRHRADLFFRRPERAGVFGDHAVHLLRDDDRWLVAASTWAGFDPADDDASVAVTLAESGDDLTRGTHVLETRALALPTDGFRSVGVWDPHLVRTDDGWLVGYVSASRFFRFHPVVAQGPSLDELTLRAAATDRRATEGSTLHRLDGPDVESRWVVLASDGRDGRRGQRERYPVLDLDLTELGELDAPYHSNIPWPTVLEHEDGALLVGFDGERYGGPLVGYGSHGQVLICRSV